VAGVVEHPLALGVEARGGLLQAAVEAVELEQPPLQPLARARPLPQRREVLAPTAQDLGHALQHDPVTVELGSQLRGAGHDQLGGASRHIGVGRGDVVAVGPLRGVPDAGDDGDRAGEHRAAQPLVVEGDEVAHAAAAAGEHDDVHRVDVLQVRERRDDGVHRAHALNERGAVDDVHARPALAQRLDDVCPGVGVPRSDDADAAREAGQRAPRPHHEAVGGELVQRGLLAGEQLALAGEADGVDVQ
jgi:hypothetical protein